MAKCPECTLRWDNTPPRIFELDRYIKSKIDIYGTNIISSIEHKRELMDINSKNGTMVFCEGNAKMYIYFDETWYHFPGLGCMH